MIGDFFDTCVESVDNMTNKQNRWFYIEKTHALKCAISDYNKRKAVLKTVLITVLLIYERIQHNK